MAIHRLFDIPDFQLAEYPQDVCVGSLEEGKLRTYNTREFIDTAEQLALGLLDLGIAPGDKVALASGNRAEWAITDQAVLRIGAISVPIYPTMTADDYAYILEHSGAKVFFVSNNDLFTKARAAQVRVPAVAHLFTYDKVPGASHWKELLGKGITQRAKLD